MARDLTINVWQYSRWVYLIGRSVKFRAFSTTERTAIVTFLNGMLAKRPGIKARFNIKRGNAYDFTTNLVKQNDYTLGKMIQVIGRDIKAKFPETGEKAICDALFAATGNRKDKKYFVRNFAITGAISPASSGTIVGVGTYAEGSVVTLTATPARGYVFSAWSDSSTATASRQVTVTANKEYAVTFTDATVRTVTAGPSVADTGTVSIEGVGGVTAPYYDGDKVKLTPVAAEGYQFSKWSDDNTESPRTVTVSGNKTYTAVFIAE